MSGFVPPNGRFAIDVTFSPSEEQTSNVNLVLNIHGKPIVLGLNIKGEGYAIHTKVTSPHSKYNWE